MRTALFLNFFIAALFVSAVSGNALADNNEAKKTVRPAVKTAKTPKDDELKDLEMFFEPEKLVVCAAKHKQQIQDAAASVVVITQDEIKNRGYRELDDLLRDVPGFDMIHVYGTWPTLYFQRGLPSSTNNRTLLLVDGINDNNLGEGAILGGHQYSLHDVKRVEIVYGPYSALYGANAVGGVINLVTKTGKDMNWGSVRAGGGYWYTFFGDATVGHYFPKQDIDFTLSGGWYRTRGPHFSQWDLANHRYNGSRADNDYRLYAKIRVKNFMLGIRFWDRPEGEGTFAVPTGMWPSNNLWHARNITIFAQHHFKPASFVTIHSKLVYRRTDIVQNSTEFDVGQDHWLWYKRRDNSIIAALDSTWYMVKWSRLTVGVSYQYSELMNYADEKKTFPPPDGDQYGWGDLALWIQEEMNPWKWFSLTAGVWQDIHTAYGQHTSPRAGLVFKPIEGMNIKILYGHAFRAPTVWERYSGVPDVRLANADLGPEFIHGLEGSIGYSWKHRLFVQAGMFWEEMKDLVELDEVDTTTHITQHQNTGRARILGAELRCQASPVKGLSAYLNYMFQHAVDPGTGEKLPYVAAHKLNVGVNYRPIRHLNINLRLNWVGPRTTAETDPLSSIDGYFLLNAAIRGVDLVRGLDITLVFRNILNRKYWDPGIRSATGTYYPTRHPQPGFSMIGFVDYRF